MAENFVFKTTTGTQDQPRRGRYVVRRSVFNAAADKNEVVYHRIGQGFSETNESLSPQVKTSNFVDGRTSSLTTGFQESWAISGERFVGSPANDMFAEMAEKRMKGPDAAVVTVVVNFYEESEAEAGVYHAYRQPGSYSPESGGGGAATDSVTISGTVNLSGLPIEGWFKPTGADSGQEGGEESEEGADEFPEDMGIFVTALADLPVAP